MVVTHFGNGLHLVRCRRGTDGIVQAAGSMKYLYTCSTHVPVVPCCLEQQIVLVYASAAAVLLSAAGKRSCCRAMFGVCCIIIIKGCDAAMNSLSVISLSPQMLGRSRDFRHRHVMLACNPCVCLWNSATQSVRHSPRCDVILSNVQFLMLVWVQHCGLHRV